MEEEEEEPRVNQRKLPGRNGFQRFSKKSLDVEPRSYITGAQSIERLKACAVIL